MKDSFDWDWAGADKEYLRALALNPNYATAHHWYGEFLVRTGRFKEGIEHLDIAVNLDPLSRSIVSSSGQMHLFARRYDEAAEILKKAIEVDPDSSGAHYFLGSVYAAKGMCKDAIDEFVRVNEKDGEVGTAQGLQRGFAEAGCPGAFRRLLELDKERAKHEYVAAESLAEDCVRLGDKEQTLQYLEKGYQEREAGMTYMAADPLWDPIRSDPRFQSLLRRMNLPILEFPPSH